MSKKNETDLDKKIKRINKLKRENAHAWSEVRRYERMYFDMMAERNAYRAFVANWFRWFINMLKADTRPDLKYCIGKMAELFQGKTSFPIDMTKKE